MSDISFNPGIPTNPNIFLNGIQGTENIHGTQDSGKVDENLTLTEDAKRTPITTSSPDIETPNPDTFSSFELADVQKKVSETFQFTPEEQKQFDASFKETVANFNASFQETSGTQGTDGTTKTEQTKETQKTDQAPTLEAKTSKVMFDLYEMMALLTECMQKMKDAQREQRKSEMESMVNSIQNQADAQRSAALTGMIAGGIVCLLQVGASAYSAYKTISNTVSDSSIANQYGVKTAATELGEAQTKLNNSVDALKTFNHDHPIPGEDDVPDVPEIAQQRAQLQQNVDTAKAELMAKKISYESKMTEMKNSDEFRALEKSQAKVKAFSDISMAVGNLGQTLIRGGMDIQQAAATAKGADQKKAEEQLAQTKDLMESFQDVINKMLQLLQAVLQAENQSMSDAIHA